METYIIGRKFQLRTDNVSLKYLFDKPNLNARQAWWLAFISEYDFEIIQIKGNENKIFDALSIKLNHICTKTTISWSTNLIEQVKTTTNSYVEYLKIKEKVKKIENLDEYKDDFSINSQDLLLFNEKIYIPNEVNLNFFLSWMSCIKYQQRVILVIRS